MSMLDLFILPIFLYFGIREYRDTFNSGQMEFWQGMTTGLLTYSMIALFFGGFLFLFLNYLDTSVTKGFIEIKLDDLTESKDKIVEEMGIESYDKAFKSTEATTVSDLIKDNMIRKGVIGFFLTSIISVIMKRKGET